MSSKLTQTILGIILISLLSIANATEIWVVVHDNKDCYSVKNTDTEFVANQCIKTIKEAKYLATALNKDEEQEKQFESKFWFRVD